MDFLVVVVVVDCGRMKRGFEQQPWEQTCATSFKQGECIMWMKINTSNELF